MHLQHLPISIAISVTAGSAFSLKFGAHGDTPWDIESATFTPSANTAADAANFADIQVLASDGSTVLAEWSTDSAVSSQGALTDGEPVALALQGKGDSIYGAEHYKTTGNSLPSAYEAKVAHTGTGAAISGLLVVTLKRGQRLQARE